MPTEDDKLQDDQTPSETPPATAPTQVLQLTPADLEAIITRMTAPIQESVRALRAEQSRQPVQTPQEPAIDDIADADLDALLAAGNGNTASAVRKLAKAEATRLVRELKTNSVDPLATTGVAALRNLALRAARSEMPHYDILGQQIDYAVRNLPPEQAGDVESILGVYRYIVGANEEKIKEKWEQERSKQDNPPRTTQPAASGRGKTGSVARESKALRPEDVLPAEALAALGDLGSNKGGRPSGMSFEDFCTRVLKRDPEQYLKEIAAEGNA